MNKMKNIYKDRLSFEYNLIHKNWGLIDDDEPYEIFYEGQITKLYSPNYPKTIGVFELMIYDLDKAKKFGQHDPIINMMNDLSNDINSQFHNFSKLINNIYLDFKNADRIIYLKNVIIHPDHRGENVLDELIKSIYITHYTKNSLYLLNCFPIQQIQNEMEYYHDDYYIDIKNGKNMKNTKVNIGDYLRLEELPKIYDEGIDYKLFARMQKLNFTKFEDTHYFYLNKEKDILQLFNNEKTSNT